MIVVGRVEVDGAQAPRPPGARIINKSLRKHGLRRLNNILLSTAFGAAIWAGTSLAGEDTGFSFLNLPAGARAAALGGAFTSIADDPTAVFWNPAGLAPEVRIQGTQSQWNLAGIHHESIQGFRQEVVGAVLRRGGEGLSLALNAHYTEGIDGRDDLGNPLGSFGVSDFAVAGGYGGTVGRGLRLGGTFQWVHETIAGTSASGLSIGGGALYDFESLSGLTLGLALLNLGATPAFKTELGGEGEGVPQPLTIAGGANYAGHLGSVGYLVTGDVRQLKGDPLEGRLGTEVVPVPMLALRLGWMLGQDAFDLTAGAGITMGKLVFDYAFVPYHDDLGSSHRAGLSARF